MEKGIEWEWLTRLQGHVNNVAYARYVESSRVNWICSFGLDDIEGGSERWYSLLKPQGVGVLLQDLRIRYQVVSCLCLFLVPPPVLETFRTLGGT